MQGWGKGSPTHFTTVPSVAVSNPPRVSSLLGKRARKSWWFPRDLNSGPLAQQPHDPVCNASLAAILCPFGRSLDIVIDLVRFIASAQVVFCSIWGS